MTYQVTARKWRPQTFAEVVGQEHITATLTNALATGRIAHCYLFCGPRGVGKDHHRPDSRKGAQLRQPPRRTDPCQECPSCVSITDGTSMDVLEIDGASNNSVDDVRELREVVRYVPTAGSHKSLHHRRSAHALHGGLQRSPENTGRAPGEGRVRLRDHRGPGRTGHDPFPLPTFQFPPHSRRTHCRAPADDRRYRRHLRGTGGPLPAGPARRRCAQGRREPDGPGRLVRGGNRGCPGSGAAGTGTGGPRRLFRSLRRGNQWRRRPRSRRCSNGSGGGDRSRGVHQGIHRTRRAMAVGSGAGHRRQSSRSPTSKRLASRNSLPVSRRRTSSAFSRRCWNSRRNCGVRFNRAFASK